VSTAALASDLCLLCTATFPPTSTSAGAHAPCGAQAIRQPEDELTSMVVALVADLVAKSSDAFPAAAAPACAVFLAHAAGCGSSEGDADSSSGNETALGKARQHCAAVSALGRLVSTHGTHVPVADVPFVLAALLRGARVRSARDTGSGSLTHGSETVAHIALAGLAALLSSQAPTVGSSPACGPPSSIVVPHTMVGDILTACAACLNTAVGPPGSSPGAPLPRGWSASQHGAPGHRDVSTSPSPSNCRLAGAALKCAAAACGHIYDSGTGAVESASQQQQQQQQPAQISSFTVGLLLSQCRRFMVLGTHDAGTADSASSWMSSGGESEDSDAEAGRSQRSPTTSRASDASARPRGGDGTAGGDRAVRLRCASCALIAALARCSAKSVHSHWPALLRPRGGTPRDHAACLPELLAHDPSPRVRAAAGHAVSVVLEGPRARAYMQVAQSAGPGAAATTLSTLLADSAVSVHTALCDALRIEECLPALVVRLPFICSSFPAH
jgi:Domain of unknown function (DUF4042)